MRLNLKGLILDPNQFAHPLYSQMLVVKGSVQGGRWDPMMRVEEMSPRARRHLEMLGVSYL